MQGSLAAPGLSPRAAGSQLCPHVRALGSDSWLLRADAGWTSNVHSTGQAPRGPPRSLSPRPCIVWVNSTPGSGQGIAAESGLREGMRTTQRPVVMSLEHQLGVRAVCAFVSLWIGCELEEVAKPCHVFSFFFPAAWYYHRPSHRLSWELIKGMDRKF